MKFMRDENNSLFKGRNIQDLSAEEKRMLYSYGHEIVLFPKYNERIVHFGNGLTVHGKFKEGEVIWNEYSNIYDFCEFVSKILTANIKPKGNKNNYN